jgi:hypothetical protein
VDFPSQGEQTTRILASSNAGQEGAGEYHAHTILQWRRNIAVWGINGLAGAAGMETVRFENKKTGEKSSPCLLNRR